MLLNYTVLVVLHAGCLNKVVTSGNQKTINLLHQGTNSHDSAAKVKKPRGKLNISKHPVHMLSGRNNKKESLRLI